MFWAFGKENYKKVKVISLTVINLHKLLISLGSRIKNKALEVKNCINFIKKRAIETYTYYDICTCWWAATMKQLYSIHY
jgi:hypothetical protein